MTNDQDAPNPVPDRASVTAQKTQNRKEMTAVDFVKLVRKDKGHNQNDLKVSGDVDLTGVTFTRPLAIHNVTFTGAVNLGRGRFKRGLDLIECRFENTLILSDAHVEGPLNLSGSHMMGNVEMIGGQIEGDVRLTGASFKSHLALANASIGGTLFATVDAASKRRCRVRSDLNMTGARIERDVKFAGTRFGAGLILENVRIGGRLLAGVDGQSHLRCRVRGEFDLTGARIEGAADLAGIHIGGGLNLENAFIGGELLLRATSNLKRNRPCVIAKQAWLLGVSIKGDLDMSGAQIAGNLIMQNATIGQNFLAKIRSGFRPQIGGETYVNGAEIHGGIDFTGSILHGDLNLDGASIDLGLTVAFDFDECDSWRIVPSTVTGRIHALSATIGIRVILMGCTVGSADTALRSSPAQGWAVDFSGAQINGMFSLCSEDFVVESLQDKETEWDAKAIGPETRRALTKQATMQRSLLHGGLRLDRAQILGGLVLDGVNIDGGLEMRDASVKASIKCRTLKPEATDPVRATARRVDLEALEMTGNIDLTGLTVTGNQRDGAGGDLFLRDARIRGRLELYRKAEMQPASASTEEAEIANIGGALRLDGAQISHVILSGHSFQRERPREIRVRVGLERATIGRLQILEPVPDTLDLSSLTVERWELPKKRKSSYLEMLENSFPFKQSNYIAIENALRNEGDDEEADKIYVEMLRRDRRTTKNSLKRFQGWFFDKSIGYGTRNLRVALVMLALFVISVSLFDQRKHIQYKIVPMAQPPPPNQHPAPNEWGLGDAALFALRLHVPIIALGVHEDFEPTGIWMETWGMAVVALSWGMWSLLLGGVSAGFIRRRK